jgi:hypothetical protein
MENTRPILYGVAAYAMFLRPRRFGKSLIISMLHAYYDVKFADRFEEFFGGTDIGANPTEERGKYLVLYFDFSAVSKNPGSAPSPRRACGTSSSSRFSTW